MLLVCKMLLSMLILCVLCVHGGGEWFACGECQCSQRNEHIVANCSGRVNNTAIINHVPTAVPITIHTLDLSEQVIHDIGSRSFRSGDLLNLHVLTLYRCQIRSVDIYAFRLLHQLQELDMSWNEIPTLASAIFETNLLLKRIQLNNNRLEELPDQLFANLTSLQELFLYGNRIQTIGANTFINNTELSFINLEDNKLKYIDYNIIEKLPALSFLVLLNNPWSCDCHSEKLLNVLTKRNLVQQEFICETEDMTTRILSEVLAENRTCSVRIVSISVSRLEDITTLACKVSTNVQPEIEWKIVRPDENITILSSDKFTLTNSTDRQDNYWLYLSFEGDIDDARLKCVAYVGNDISEKIVLLPMRLRAAALSSWIFYFVGAITALCIIAILGFLLIRRCKRKKQDNEDVAPDTPSSSYEYHDDTALHKMMYLTGSQELA